LAGLSKRTFVEMLGKYGVSLFSQTADELKSDIDNASKLLKPLQSPPKNAGDAARRGAH
jgi:hypothetical protein